MWRLCRRHDSESINDSHVEQANGDARGSFGVDRDFLAHSRVSIGVEWFGLNTGPFSACMGIKPDLQDCWTGPRTTIRSHRVIKRFAPVAMLFAAACGGGKDGTGPVAKPSDISSMNVGE